MITGIRSILICDQLEEDESGANYIGVAGYDLLSSDRPSSLELWVAILFETDRRVSPGHIKISAPEFSYTFSTVVPEGRTLAALAIPCMVPVLRESLLHVTITDEAKPARPWKYKWRLGFADDAVDRPDIDVPKLIRDCREAMAMVKDAEDAFATKALGRLN